MKSEKKHLNKKKQINKEIPQSTEVMQQEIFFGRHVVLKIFKDGKKINRLFLQKGVTGGQIKDIVKLAKQLGVVIVDVPKVKLDELTNGENHQGVVVTVAPYEYKTLEDCFQLAHQRNETPFLLLLDGIEDPHNLGSIIRTAEATGVHGIIIPKRRAVGLTGIVAKTSAGAIEQVPVVRVTNMTQTIELLKKKGIWVFATAMQGEDMRRWDTTGPLAVVIGNEGNGVSQSVIKVCDGQVTIPMTGTIQSLNASVAAGVLMYEVARNRLTLK